jgi:peptidoglycan/xylan/chitin deacetylase (PgdA/CDA1 family)
MRSILSNWPKLVTLALLLLTLAIGFTFFSRMGTDAAAQSPTASPTQFAQQTSTRTPTRTATATKRATVTTTATRRPPTPTWTPFPTATATPAASSPLGVATPTSTDRRLVPLPEHGPGPNLVPGAVGSTIITSTVITSTGSVTDAIEVTDTTELTSTSGQSETIHVPLILAPAPTVTPTISIVEALEQPVGPRGMAGVAAKATAEALVAEQPIAETPTDAQSEPPLEAPTEPIAEPTATPLPTPASAPTPDGSVRTARVPILMYHYLSAPPAGADIYRQDLSVSPELFAAHLDAMQQAGYTAISLYALLDHLTHGAPLPERPVVLTFDDGYVDNYTNAFPILRDHGMTATFFIVTDFIHDKRPEYLTWDMVREMYAGGMSIEAHGRNHVSLAKKDRDYLIWQALGSFESIQVEIGVRPHFISYPAGDYDDLTIEIFRSADYWAGFTTKQGATHRSDDLFRMNRVRVHGTTTPEELLQILALDW